MKLPLTYDETWGLIHDADGAEVVACHSNKADAADIVRACNSHYDLLAALEMAKRIIANGGGVNGDQLEVIESAIARSKGEV